MNINIIQQKLLCSTIRQGQNHILLQPTIIAKAIASIMQTFNQLVLILHQDQLQFPIEAARSQLQTSCLSILKAASQANKYGFKFSGSFLFDILVVKNETEWLLKHLFCSGLDKATNNACFICIKQHIRLQALERLSRDDFLPCKTSSMWDLPSTILNKVSHDSSEILPECLPPFQLLYYLMATYKQYKAKYRWLTNAHNTVFSNIAVLLSITSKVILESVKTWAQSKVINHKNFL
jgi:UDP-N-acetylglucosamine pyrophosphorylase